MFHKGDPSEYDDEDYEDDEEEEEEEMGEDEGKEVISNTFHLIQSKS